MEYLFSYGSLQKADVQNQLFGRVLPGVTGRLNGYTVILIEIEDETFLSKGEGRLQKTLFYSGDPDDCIEGVVLKVTSKELYVADQYEPKCYKRIKVQVRSGQEVWIYIADKG